ncbi:MAG: addiction module protein [Pyrinomonadaceae bacterium]|nr:addiction module protein [Pyrinomonadaceae bacterium]
MSTRTTELLQEILSMPPDERAELADDILASLEPADPRILTLWAAEAEERVAAFERGEIEAVSADSVFDEIDRQRTL